jgi:metal-sulfur cluster biosynthetic enzyme
MPVLQDDVLSALRQCYDPEIPVNIVDLGLVYDVRFVPTADEEKQDVIVEMTLTAKSSHAGTLIGDQIKRQLKQLPGIREAIIQLVWIPPWSPERLTAEARKILGVE